MATTADPEPSRGRRRRPLVLALIAAALAVIVVLVLLLGGGDDDSGGDVPAGTARLFFPGSWARLDDAAVGRFGETALLGIRRKDRTGLIVVRREPERTQGFGRIGRELRARLARRFRDFRPISQRTVRTRAGEAFYFSYARTRAGTANSITIASVGDRNYSLNTTLRAGADRSAAEAGQIIRSFGPAQGGGASGDEPADVPRP